MDRRTERDRNDKLVFYKKQRGEASEEKQFSRKQLLYKQTAAA